MTTAPEETLAEGIYMSSSSLSVPRISKPFQWGRGYSSIKASRRRDKMVTESTWYASSPSSTPSMLLCHTRQLMLQTWNKSIFSDTTQAATFSSYVVPLYSERSGEAFDSLASDWSTAVLWWVCVWVSVCMCVGVWVGGAVPVVIIMIPYVYPWTLIEVITHFDSPEQYELHVT